MSHLSVRQCHLFIAETLADAQHYLQQRFPNNTWSIIDTTTDYNQNRWLGRELGHTLLYFNEQTGINQLLSVWGCVRGGCYFAMAHPPSHPPTLPCKSYFYRTILLPSLYSVARQSQIQSQMQSQILPLTAISDDSNSTETIALTQQLLSTTSPVIQLLGERGTGKSTLLGYTAKQWLLANKPVVLCAPLASSSENTLKIINEDVSRETFCFVTPDKLTKLIATRLTKEGLTEETLMIIDEASACSQIIIKKAIQWAEKQQAKLILSTTLEGYEGSGQSYRLAYLNTQNYPGIMLHEPKRYAVNDPLHRLAKHLSNPSSSTINLPDGIAYYTTQALRKHNLVEAVFVLLRDAHYKTTPNDLRRFYDEEACFVVSISNQQLIGAVYALPEKLPDNIAFTDIYNGSRRVKNALTQQALIHAYGEKRLMHKKILRISRICVVEDKRCQGIATQMINALRKEAAWQYDALSISFSVNPITLAFWQAQQGQAVRVGIYRNKWQGAYALLMLIPLNDAMQVITHDLHKHFNRHINYHRFYPTIIRRLASDDGKPAAVDENTAVSNLDSVLQGHRDIHWALPFLSAYYCHSAHEKMPENSKIANEINNKKLRNSLNRTQKAALIAKLRQLIKI